ncbi:class I SAM-dependent methyltransferase [Brevibacillus borstelensis]|uniref:class I SAM-dependent methyltransferase n=1 Tax=Brevibacillus borstelensis TaxID=45462 RepID=UPI0030BA728D
MAERSVKVQELLETIRGIEGWLTELEQIALLHLPARVDGLPGDIVEIGSFKGKSTVALGLGCFFLSATKRKVFAIDPFGPHVDPDYPDLYYTKDPYFHIFLENVKSSGVGDIVHSIRKLSTEAYVDCPNQIAALFIDGDHRYEGVQHDLQFYSPKVVRGGIIACHDYGHAVFPGVKLAVDEICDHPDFEYVCDYDSLRLIRKIH